MKQRLILIVGTLGVLGLAPSTFADDNARIQKEKMVIQKFNHESTNSIGKYNFPLTVNSFTKDLGQPDSTLTDDNESCPVGQIHSWCLRSQNLNILVLGDHYQANVNYSAEARLFAVAKCDSAKDTGFNGLWGIRLGDSDSKVNEKLSQIVKQNKSSKLKTNIKGAPIHLFLNGFSISHHHTMQKDDLYFYFVMNREGKLEVIIQSSFDLSIAC
jgi:hypothetical protein